MRRLIFVYTWIAHMILLPKLIGQSTPPHLKKTSFATQLIVEDHPYLICGGELGNSTATTMENMASVWSTLTALHLNTVLIPVYWELVEPEEGQYDFNLYRDLIREARNHHLKIIFLWFGAWKNSMSSHAPAWVKLNQSRFPRSQDENGISQEILSCFSSEVLEVDRQAFEHLMEFIKKEDEQEHTVIMVQVENEIGMLPSARDHQELAERAFHAQVPIELLNYMSENKDHLVPEFRSIWEANGFRVQGSWEEVFGASYATDEIFMAWYYAYFANELAGAGKTIHPLPMYVNAALNRPGWLPGQYPSAGPLPHLMDIWQAAGKNLDLLAPDFYFPNFEHWCDLYIRQDNTLFVPEHRFDETVPAKALYSIAHYHGLGFSPFSIESKSDPEEEPLGEIYAMIQNISPVLNHGIAMGEVEGVLLTREHPETVVTLGNYELTCRHDYTLPWTPGSTTDDWPVTSAVLIHTGKDAFFVAGNGVVITFKALDEPASRVGLLKVDEGRFEASNWHITRHLNGDQTHQGRHVRLPAGNVGIQRVQLYRYD